MMAFLRRVEGPLFDASPHQPRRRARQHARDIDAYFRFISSQNTAPQSFDIAGPHYQQVIDTP